MKKNSPEYWEERMAQKVWGTYNSIEEKNIRLLEMYQDAAKDISYELYTLGQKLGTDGVLSRSDMYKQNRLTEMKQKMEHTIEGLGQKTESFTKDNLNAGYKDTYQNTMEQLGGIDYALPNKKAMEEMLDRPWHGSNFSDRLWSNTESLSAVLNDSLVRGIEQGKTTTEMAIEIANAVQSGFNVTHRLVRTETIHFLNSASMQGYKDSGVKKVQYWAAEDERTCKDCGDGGYHGKLYDITKAPILPIHPNCRCTYLPVVEEEGTVSIPDTLKLSGNLSDTVKTSFEKEISLIPKKHMSIIESEVKKVVVDAGGNSRYNRTTGILYLSDDLEEGEVIHEMAHALETKLGIFQDEEFISAIQETLGEINPMWDIITDEDTFVKPIERLLKTDHLLSVYQGRIYSEIGAVNDEMEFNYHSLGDFFTEAYRTYVLRPDELKQKQPNMYEYIERIET